MPTVRHGRPARRACLSAGLLAVLAWGCAARHPLAYTPALPESIRRRATTVEVVAVSPESGTQARLGGEVGRGRSTGKGAAAGAATGASAGLLVSLQTGPFFVFIAPILVPAAAVIGGAGGAAVGYASGIPLKEGQAAQALLARNQRDLSAELARRVARRLPAAGKAEAPPGSSPDLRVEVTALSWGLFGGAGSHPVAGFEWTGDYRVLDAKGAELLHRQFTVSGSRRLLAEWTGEDGRRLGEALEATLEAAAEAVADSAFLIQDFHLPVGMMPATCGLLPRRPGRASRAFGLLAGATPEVEGPSPLLQWEAFPRRADLDHDAEHLLARISDIRYDLRIWASIGGGPGDLVYERPGLRLESRTEGSAAGDGGPAPMPFVEHRLETALAPATEYLWSVRARFRLDGEERATRWSMNQDLDPRTRSAIQRWSPFGTFASPRRPCLYDGIPPLHHHRFRTP